MILKILNESYNKLEESTSNYSYIDNYIKSMQGEIIKNNFESALDYCKQLTNILATLSKGSKKALNIRCIFNDSYESNQINKVEFFENFLSSIDVDLQDTPIIDVSPIDGNDVYVKIILDKYDDETPHIIQTELENSPIVKMVKFL